MSRPFRLFVGICAVVGCVGDTSEPVPDAATDSSFSDSSDSSVASDATNDADATSDADASTKTTRTVFITSAVFDANLQGLAGADAKCQSAAAAAGLSGTFLAWISTSTNSPKLRFAPSAVPYVLVDGTPIASDFAHLTGGVDLLHPIDRDEHNQSVAFDGGGLVTSGIAWTQTKSDGTPAPFSGNAGCSDFTSAEDAATTLYAGAGCTTATNAQWSLCENLECNIQAALYCFEQ